MGKNLHRYIDATYPPRKVKDAGEDCENLPVKEGKSHKGTYRYKRAYLDHKVLDNMMKKHVNEPYEVLYGDIAKLFKTGSLERRQIEQDLVWMSKPDAATYLYREGYYIINGIIRCVLKVKGKITILDK